MSTPKDAYYKLRQQEFRKLNSAKRRNKVPAGVSPGDYDPPVVDIKHKEQFIGKKGV